MTNATIPAELAGIAPQVGSVWEWEPLKPWARMRCRVTEVVWNGEEAWVRCEGEDGIEYLNELSRWVEATVMVSDTSETHADE